MASLEAQAAPAYFVLTAFHLPPWKPTRGRSGLIFLRCSGKDVEAVVAVDIA
jgi:hypothetical protein